MYFIFNLCHILGHKIVALFCFSKARSFIEQNLLRKDIKGVKERPKRKQGLERTNQARSFLLNKIYLEWFQETEKRKYVFKREHGLLQNRK